MVDSSAASNIGTIANDASTNPQLQQPRSPPQRARVSAQPQPAKILANGCVIDQAVMPPSQ